MTPIVRKLVKITLAVAGGAVLLGVAGLMGFRMLVRELPSYQADLQAWVNSTLGVRLGFTSLDARWSLRGPELTFHDVSIATVDDVRPFVTARSASVGFGPGALLARLVTKREVTIDRLTLEGTELTVVKTDDGQFRLQGAPTSRADFALDVPPDVELIVRDSRVIYLDQSRSLAWDFQNVAGSMTRDANSLLLEASAQPPRDFASRVELTAQGFAAAGPDGGDRPRFTGDWRVSVDVDGIDLAVAARLLPAATVVPQAGRGNVAVWFEWRDGAPVNGNVELALSDVSLPTVLGTAGSRFDRIAFNADWQHDAGDWRIALKNVAVTRGGRAWPGGADADIDIEENAEGLARVALHSDFLRLEDLTPFFWPLPPSRLLDSWFALAPRGDVRNAAIELHRTNGQIEYSVGASFAGVGIEAVEKLPGVTSLTGEVHADSRSGRVELHTAAAALTWPTVFRAPLTVSELRGIVLWRQGQDALRVVSDDLVVATPDASTRSNLELTVPLDGAPVRLDLQTSVSGFDLRAVSRYLPVPTMPTSVVEWLDAAFVGGHVDGTELSFVGPLRAFPFDGGEGRFHVTANVEGGELAFISDWPHAEGLTGQVEFENASFKARGAGRVLGNRTDNVDVGFADLRLGVLAVHANTKGPLGDVLTFLQRSPLIAHHLGPDFARLDSPAGSGAVDLGITLPLLDRAAYRLKAGLDITGGELAFRGFGPHATEIHGKLEVDEHALRGNGIKAIFLDGPITARIDVPKTAGYRTQIDMEGEVTIDAVANAFDLPFPTLLAGQTTWQGSLLIPAPDDDAKRPPKITIDSNLSGIALRYPAPFAKAPSEPLNLQIGLTFADGGGLDLEGYVGASRRFGLQFDPVPSGREGQFAFRRAALRFGGAPAAFRADAGVTVDGALPQLSIDEWLGLARAAGGGSTKIGVGFAGAELDVAKFTAFGQQLGSTKVGARRRTDDWQIEIESNPVAGTLLVPMNLSNEPQIVAVMRRLYLNAGEGGAMRLVDPRQLPGLQLHADEFAIGARRLGRLDAEVLSDPLGLRLVSFESASDGFTAQGSGGWFTGADGDTTRIALTMTSNDVAKGLTALGLDPIMEAKHAEVTASVYWAGPPSGDWMQHVSGDLAIRTEKGSLVDLAPGAGRVVGLFSVSALPRRLALDFRDVFNRGLVFDEITADFVVIDGNAYTDNLKLTGPAAEIGIVGRTGLRDHDYRQQAVVTAEPGKMLPTVGGLLGGPAVAAALLIFTRIFKEPLKGIGRASYCVTGKWEEPMVERLTEEQLEKGEICAELPPNGELGKPAEVAAR